MRIGILGVTGYSGSELTRWLLRHPEATITSVTGRSYIGQKLGEAFPYLADLDLTIGQELDSVDLVFSGLPSEVSAQSLLPYLRQGIPAVDISPDFRLKDPAVHSQWYGFDHPAPDLLETAVYGLVELNREQVSTAKLVANPGCYPTSVILALAPALKEGIIRPDIVADSKSGVSGAGRTLSLTTHFSEINENVQAYSLGGHRHLPEMVQELQRYCRDRVSVTFVPHLIPMTRGILSTCYAPLEVEMSAQEVRDLYQDFYRGETFVRVTVNPPQTKQTLGTNLCLLHPVVDPRAGRLVVVSCIDNLVKGAAVQAIQNMNLMLGLPEGMGLQGAAVFP
ncbi:MAG TPA: N-acetyl-gamma-glutamyl-phosphate reductase [Dehalococcoidia bacterium]|nr:N-acetyl-gamma-glutamyl-phosphate reductase [Dehalococcoidia bacterium]